jgi:DNA-binding MarR family transcriptional regulator
MLYLELHIQVKQGVVVLTSRRNCNEVGRRTARVARASRRGVLQELDLSGTGTCASFNFRRTTRAVTRLYDAAFEKFGIRSTQFAILIGMAKTQPVAMSALAEVLLMDATTLTRSLQLLKKQGLVAISERAAKRQRFLTLTRKGEEMLAKTLPVWRKMHTRFVAEVGEEHWLKLRSELEQLAHTAMQMEAR